jgi:hypothetical protein
LNRKAFYYAIGAGVLLAMGMYALVGLLQAYILFSGERAWSNVQFWGPISLVLLGGAIICAYRAYIISLQSLKSRRH